MSVRTGLQFDLKAEARVVVMGNLGSLLMADDRLPEAIQVMQEAIELAGKHDIPTKRVRLFSSLPVRNMKSVFRRQAFCSTMERH